MILSNPLKDFTVRNLSLAIKQRDVSAEEVAGEVIARCELHAKYNTLISQDPEGLLAAARAADQHQSSGAKLGPLHGVPLLIKDNIDTKDLPTTGGTPAFENDYPRKDAPVVRRLLESGAIIAGKSNLHECAVGATSDNIHYGVVHNPYHFDYIPGGSSGGTAAAIAARMVPGGLGTDTYGSVRVPSAMCGIAGFRPSSGRYPGGGVFPPCHTRDTVGPMAQNSADLALLDGILSGTESNLDVTDLKGVRLGLPHRIFREQLDARTARVFDGAVDLLKELGAVIVEADIPEFSDLTNKTAQQIGSFETKRDMPAYFETRGTDVTISRMIDMIASPIVKVRIAGIMSLKPEAEEAYEKAMTVHRPAIQKIIRHYYNEHSLAAIIFPTSPFPAVEVHDEVVTINGETDKTAMWRLLDNLTYQTVVGAPSLSVPAGLTTDGLPVGLNFDGLPGTDQQILALGHAFERAAGPLPPPSIS